MHTRITPTFKISLLTAAMLTLSGCASIQKPSDIGEHIVDAGRATSRVLGFGPKDEPAFDGVDTALIDVESTTVDGQTVQTSTTVLLPQAESIAPPPSGTPAIASTPAIDPNQVPVATVDYTHVVGPNETMWTIAKDTTGNADNWQTLAEINQLDLNTPMQIGQRILIPADLVLPQVVATVIQTETFVDDETNTLVEETSTTTYTDLAPLELRPLPSADDSEITRLDADNVQPITQAELERDPLAQDAGALVALDADASPELQTGEQTENLMADADAAAPAAALPVDPSENAVALKADVGETLWDMAKRTTGDATNWQAIADQNGFTEKDIGRIRYGQTIYVPVEMAKVELGGANVVAARPAPAQSNSDADASATDELVAASTSNAAPNSNEEAIDASAEMVATASDAMDENQEITIVEAAFQPTDVDQLVNAKPVPEGGAGEVIMVSGTYYPKAVYNEADFSSSLLMRVSPGTEMVVSRAMGPWYEVTTEHGIGYMHSRDIK